MCYAFSEIYFICENTYNWFAKTIYLYVTKSSSEYEYVKVPESPVGDKLKEIVIEGSSDGKNGVAPIALIPEAAGVNGWGSSDEEYEMVDTGRKVE